MLIQVDYLLRLISTFEPYRLFVSYDLQFSYILL